MRLLTPAELRFVTTHLGHPRSIEILRAAAAGRSVTRPPCPRRRPQSRRHARRRFLTDAEREAIRRDYRNVPIPELATRLGRSPSAIYQNAAKLHLTRKLCPRGEDLVRFIRAQHMLGWSDNEIAAAWSGKFPGRVRMNRHTIGEYRKRLGLPSNALSEHRRRRVAKKTAEQVARAGLPALSHLRLAVWREKARAQGWPEDLSPPYVKILNALWDFGPQTRRELVDRCGFRWKGSRASMHSNDPNGSFLAHLMARGLVVCLGRKVQTGRKGGNVCLYMISPNIQRKKVSHAQSNEPAKAGEHDGDRAAPAVDGGHPLGGLRGDQVRGRRGDLRKAG